LREEALPAGDVCLITVYEKAVPSMIQNKVGAVTFESIARANLYAQLVLNAHDRKQEKQNSVFVGLRKALEADLVEAGQRSTLLYHLSIAPREEELCSSIGTVSPAPKLFQNRIVTAAPL